MTQEWREWSREKLEHEYSPSQWAKRPYAEYALLLEASSEVSRRSIGDQLVTEQYGPGSRNILAWVEPASRNEIFVWIHGGYWQGSSIAEALGGVEALVSQGFGFAAIEYTLAPEITVAGIVDECEYALQWLQGQNPGSQIILGGHSAGAHLALAVAARNQVAGLVLVSGVFDLRPIAETSINDALGLTQTQAHDLSPILVNFPYPCPSEVLVGGEESPSFHEQARTAFEYLSKMGSESKLLSISGLDHFDIILSGEHLKSFLRLANR